MKLSLLVSLIGFGLAAIFLSLPMAAAATEFTTPLFNCPAATDAASLSDCASKNQEKLANHKILRPYAHTDGAAIYALLGNLPQGHPAENEPIATRRLRSSIGEWLYYSTPDYIEENGKPPATYGDACTEPECLGALEVYKRPDGRYLLFFWDYLAAHNTINLAYMLDASGKMTSLTMQDYDTDQKQLTQRSAAFDQYHFNPTTNILSDGSVINCCMSVSSEYKLNGELFELQKLTQTELSDTGKETTTVLYERKN